MLICGLEVELCDVVVVFLFEVVVLVVDLFWLELIFGIDYLVVFDVVCCLVVVVVGVID